MKIISIISKIIISYHIIIIISWHHIIIISYLSYPSILSIKNIARDGARRAPRGVMA